jgi:hypothetical protein
MLQRIKAAAVQHGFAAAQHEALRPDAAHP